MTELESLGTQPTSADRVVELLQSLIAIESVNPAYAGGSGEAAVADYVERWGRGLGLDVVRQPVFPGRDNILVTLCVPGASQTLLYEAHMDTVALAPMGDDALRPVVRDGRLYGRGACDTKGSLAAMLVAIERLKERRAELDVNVALLAAVDEEHAFRGVLSYAESDAAASAAIVGEPTDLRIVVAHKGCVRGTIQTRGRAAHSSEPERGISAIDGMADVLIGLRSLRHRLLSHHHALLGQPTFTVGLIEGGTGVNTVPERCTLTYDRRTLPGERLEHVLAEIDEVLENVRAACPTIAIERPEPVLIDGALDTATDSALVRAARATCDAFDISSELIGVPYGTDASKLQRHRGIPSIVFGPGSIAQAHGADEFVPLDDLAAAVAVYEGIALRFTGA
jgi:acetylornithine deacetylase